MKSIVLAAGYATRLYPLTENFPKPLLKVGEKSILDRLLEDLDKTDITEFVVVSNHKFIDHFNEWKKTLSYTAKVTILDDGSTDNSNQICDEFKAKDSRCKVIHQINSGLSAARNTALRWQCV